jgi:hypothetical protein
MPASYTTRTGRTVCVGQLYRDAARQDPRTVRIDEIGGPKVFTLVWPVQR